MKTAVYFKFESHQLVSAIRRSLRFFPRSQLVLLGTTFGFSLAPLAP